MFLILCRGLGFIPLPCVFQENVSCSHVFPWVKRMKVILRTLFYLEHSLGEFPYFHASSATQLRGLPCLIQQFQGFL